MTTEDIPVLKVGSLKAIGDLAGTGTLHIGGLNDHVFNGEWAIPAEAIKDLMGSQPLTFNVGGHYWQDQLEKLFQTELAQSDYVYFEIARTRRTDWMAWICSHHIESHPDRKVYAMGQGETLELACKSAVGDYHERFPTRSAD